MPLIVRICDLEVQSDEYKRVVEEVFSGAEGDWAVSLLSVAPSLEWELRVTGPNSKATTETLSGPPGAGQQTPDYLRARLRSILNDWMQVQQDTAQAIDPGHPG